MTTLESIVTGQRRAWNSISDALCIASRLRLLPGLCRITWGESRQVESCTLQRRDQATPVVEDRAFLLPGSHVKVSLRRRASVRIRNRHIDRSYRIRPISAADQQREASGVDVQQGIILHVCVEIQALRM